MANLNWDNYGKKPPIGLSDCGGRRENLAVLQDCNTKNIWI